MRAIRADLVLLCCLAGAVAAIAQRQPAMWEFWPRGAFAFVLPTGRLANPSGFENVCGTPGPGGGFGADIAICTGRQWLFGVAGTMEIFSKKNSQLLGILLARYAAPATALTIDEGQYTPGNNGLVLYAGRRWTKKRWLLDAALGAGAAGLHGPLGVTVVRKTIGSNAVDTISLRDQTENAPAVYFQLLARADAAYRIGPKVLLRAGVRFTTGIATVRITERTQPLFGEQSLAAYAFRQPVSTISASVGFVIQQPAKQRKKQDPEPGD